MESLVLSSQQPEKHLEKTVIVKANQMSQSGTVAFVPPSLLHGKASHHLSILVSLCFCRNCHFFTAVSEALK